MSACFVFSVDQIPAIPACAFGEVCSNTQQVHDGTVRASEIEVINGALEGVIVGTIDLEPHVADRVKVSLRHLFSRWFYLFYFLYGGECTGKPVAKCTKSPITYLPPKPLLISPDCPLISFTLSEGSSLAELPYQTFSDINRSFIIEQPCTSGIE